MNWLLWGGLAAGFLALCVAYTADQIAGAKFIGLEKDDLRVLPR